MGMKSQNAHISINGVDIDWNLEKGSFNFLDIPSTLFWNNPSLLNMFKPLVEELGKEMFCLQVAYSSSLGTDEDYNNMVTQLGGNFEQGFLNWGKAVGAAGWGVFELPYINLDDVKAKVVVHNPWELSMQSKLSASQRWGCPFLQGKIIGIFNHAFHTTCWADEELFVDAENSRVEFIIYAHSGTIHDKIEALRKRKEQEKVIHLQELIQEGIKENILLLEKEQNLRKNLLEYQSSLEKSEVLKKNILETIPDMMWLKDIDGIYMACNPEFELFFGAKESEIVGKTDYDFVDKELADFFREHDRKAMYAGKPSINEEWITYASDGHKALLETTKTPLHNNAGEIIGVLGIGHDITKRYEAERFVQMNANILKMIASGEDASNVYNEIAVMYEERHPGMRCSLLELRGNTLVHACAPSLPDEYCNAINGVVIGDNVGSCGTSTFTGQTVLVKDINTDLKWANYKEYALKHGMQSCWSEPIKDSSGKVLGSFAMYYDEPALPNAEELEDLSSAARLTSIVMERDRSQKHIQRLAYTDELTGLASRAFFLQVLEKTLNIAERKEKRFALLYIDLDDFKNVNDSLGHDVGDILLQAIAQRLSSICRDNDLTVRLSGDEFCVLINEIDDNYDAAHVARRVLAVISEPMTLIGRNFTPSCSIGIAHYPDDAKDISTLLKAADTALYSSKENGKNQFSFYTQELTQKAERLFQIEQYLREAIEQDSLDLAYQAQVDTKTKEVVGIEALCRWEHPELGRVSPVEFIPMAEKIGMIKKLTEWVLKMACMQAVAWEEEGLLRRISVNISPTHFLDPELVHLVEKTLQETGLEPSRLELEVTESVVQTDVQNLVVFEKLKALGVLIALDDFGTGYSSFASLKHLTVDNLKIDKYFIDELLIDKESKYLVKTMIQLGHNLNYGIIAEGVESQKQFEKLEELECESIQGYFFSKPLSADKMRDFLVQSVS